MKENWGLYNSSFEHDACGIGAVVNIKGKKSNKIINDALDILENLKHRGGTGADENTGDGAGILIQIPHNFFKRVCNDKNINLPENGEYTVGVLFLPNEEKKREIALNIMNKVLMEKHYETLLLRDVPIDYSGLGKAALESMPKIQQVILNKPNGIENDKAFERELYILRRNIEKAFNSEKELNDCSAYIASLSSKTMVYKGMLLSTQVREFYSDLLDKDVESAIALVHSRYSTNTFPSWERAHPNRMMVHNGEINTLRGNVNKIYSREGSITSEIFGDKLSEVLPIINKEGSDSATFDNVLEFLYMGGRDLARSILMLIPEPWEKSKNIDEDKKAFYKYNSTLMEPWDGPASIVFTDGDRVGAVLDRNGLRPSRYYITDDEYLYLSSETGAVYIDEERVIRKDRLEPGKILLVDTVKGQLIEDAEVKKKYSLEKPYKEWLDERLTPLKSINIDNYEEKFMNKEERTTYQKTFGYGYEDLKTNIYEMAQNMHEPMAAMGIDTPLAVLSLKEQPLFNYFKQLFAQVTNPPIDAIREEIVTSTNVYLGSKGNILDDCPESCRQIEIVNPIINDKDLEKIKLLDGHGYNVKTLDITFDKTKENSLEISLKYLCREALQLIKEGANVIILSDRFVDEANVPIPSLLAVAAMNNYLIKKGVRSLADIIIETAEAREVHHFATLLGYGATAVNPYLAYQCIHELIEDGMVTLSYTEATDNYDKAVVKGITKILSKMGISAIRSYQGAQIFEALGIDKSVIDKYFTNTTSRIGGLTLNDIEKEAVSKHEKAYNKRYKQLNLNLDNFGRDKLRSEGENHLYNPVTIYMLQQATRTGDYKKFKEYSTLINKEEEGLTLRGLLDFEFEENHIPLEEVESVASIVKRFKTGAMSYGSISKEAHEALAIAMNRLGGKSNTGEGGEDRERWVPLANGDSKRSKIKQIASGRFGVTSEYLVNADELQIKMAQGAKPGEGGQLPAHKVYPWIAKTRKSTTAVGLISPPPHHDIYSIEDLAQLIYDLKNSNIYADISVKLVAEAGVGTIAAGVAKAGADVILVSGYDGGTGASPKTSIQHAGLPWELGLAEAHQTLVMNNLRDRVRVETDGKLMTGRDVAIAALLGAEEFGFATAPLVALGCVMMRVCNLDTCPVGVATQNEELRKRFTGKPEYVVNFMEFIAEELREYMAKLGFRTIGEMVGRVDKLKKKEKLNNWKAERVDLSLVLDKSQVNSENGVKFNIENKYDHKLNLVKDSTLLLELTKPALDNKDKVKIELDILNTDRTFGTILGSEITRRYNEEGLEEDTIWIKCTGAAGQSFGAFIPNGLTLEVEGDGNDYVGKGLSGGKIVVYPPKNSKIVAEENIIVGNVALYGATSGKAFFNGVVGERFCVRNSGATAVIEGCGAHGCEYMTGGKAVILGETGVNFAAGMSGGIAYVLDENEKFVSRVNKEMVLIEVPNSEDSNFLKDIITEHYKLTSSQKAKAILDNFDLYISKIKKVIPKDYKEVLELVKINEKKGFTRDEALVNAFYEKTGKRV
ncbi:MULTISPECIES: glutamate synthase large subunit [unclassified Clostridium]|uniref:glutamate synthase large subunit n=1 Tax=unclassified Clostridium TaxID=2614128 RepID=UPI001C8C1136|nr:MULTISPECIES: glutamate synthase large subunit [unclassified Clostridium]MBX9139122.1 glutamate synthase large subunit [Clostridium sp. K12(2020)]MBX9145903.1 glutamate synthase large subunit [Clostridium sp. K13]